MIWYLSIMGFIFVLLFIGLCMVDKINQRKKRDPEFSEKVERFFNKTDPFFNFLENLTGWTLALLFIYFIALR
jgi:hypothetical protein